MFIYLVRHGETDWSASGRHTSHTDQALTTEGRQQAYRLLTYVSLIRFVAVRTSPLQRARLTCELSGAGASAVVDPDLREWDYGDYEGITSVEIHRTRPDWNVFADGCPGGESVQQVSDRADRVIANLHVSPGSALLFSHGHFLRALALRWIGLPVAAGEHFALGPGSLSILQSADENGHASEVQLWNFEPPVSLPSSG